MPKFGFAARGTRRATRQAAVNVVRSTVEATDASLKVSLQIAREWRVFCNMDFFGRVKWICTGRITLSARAKEALHENLNNPSEESVA